MKNLIKQQYDEQYLYNFLKVFNMDCWGFEGVEILLASLSM